MMSRTHLLVLVFMLPCRYCNDSLYVIVVYCLIDFNTTCPRNTTGCEVSTRVLLAYCCCVVQTRLYRILDGWLSGSLQEIVDLLNSKFFLGFVAFYHAEFVNFVCSVLDMYGLFYACVSVYIQLDRKIL